jgi:hypothetical protein
LGSLAALAATGSKVALAPYRLIKVIKESLAPDQVNQTPSAQSVVTSGAAVTQPQSKAEVMDFTHLSIISTVFWVGEGATADNSYIPNKASAWDEKWLDNFGGVDDPKKRNGFMPASFTPKENPFYIALPYSDFTDNGDRKSSAGVCPQAASKSSYSWCKNSWVAIRKNGNIAYGQWEDVGPYEEDDLAYVFGAAQPKNTRGDKSGVDISPAIRDFLGLDDVDKVDWGLVPAQVVPDGPWKRIITTTPGTTAN